MRKFVGCVCNQMICVPDEGGLETTEPVALIEAILICVEPKWEVDAPNKTMNKTLITSEVRFALTADTALMLIQNLATWIEDATALEERVTVVPAPADPAPESEPKPEESP